MSEQTGNPIKAHIFKGGQGTDAAVVLTFTARPGRIIRLVHVSLSLSGGSAALAITGLQDEQTYSVDIKGGVNNAFLVGGGIDGIHAKDNTDLVATLEAAGSTNVGKLNVAVVYDLPTKAFS